MKHNNDNAKKQQIKTNGGLQFPWKFAVIAAGILMLVLSAGCAGQRGDAAASTETDSEGGVEVREGDGAEAGNAAGETIESDKDAVDTSEVFEDANETAEAGEEAAETTEAGEKTDSESPLDAFLSNKIPALDSSNESYRIFFADLSMDLEEWDSYSVGERIDLDNDGENELILNGPYGGMYLDARAGNVYILATGDGTSQVLSHISYDDAMWIVHSDTTHQGRKVYWLTKYDGGGNIVDEFTLSAEYWDSPDDKYNADSDFTFRDQKISMEEYEALHKEIFGSVN